MTLSGPANGQTKITPQAREATSDVLANVLQLNGMPVLVMLADMRNLFPEEWEAFADPFLRDPEKLNDPEGIAYQGVKFWSLFLDARLAESGQAPAAAIKPILASLADEAQLAAASNPLLCIDMQHTGLNWRYPTTAKQQEASTTLKMALLKAIHEAAPSAAQDPTMSETAMKQALAEGLAAGGATAEQSSAIMSGKWTALPPSQQCQARELLYRALAKGPDDTAKLYWTNRVAPANSRTSTDPKTGASVTIYSFASWMETLRLDPVYEALRKGFPSEWQRLRLLIHDDVSQKRDSGSVVQDIQSFRRVLISRAMQSSTAAPGPDIQAIYRAKAAMIETVVKDPAACRSATQGQALLHPSPAQTQAYQAFFLALIHAARSAELAPLAHDPIDPGALTKLQTRFIAAGGSKTEADQFFVSSDQAAFQARSCRTWAIALHVLADAPVGDAAAIWAFNQDQSRSAPAIDGKTLDEFMALLAKDPSLDALRGAFPEEWAALRQKIDTALKGGGQSSKLMDIASADAQAAIRRHSIDLAHAPMAQIRPVIAAQDAVLRSLKAQSPTICARYVLGLNAFDLDPSESIRAATEQLRAAAAAALAAAAKAPVVYDPVMMADQPAFRAAFEKLGGDMAQTEALAQGRGTDLSSEQICALGLEQVQTMSTLPDALLGRIWAGLMGSKSNNWVVPKPSAGLPGRTRT